MTGPLSWSTLKYINYAAIFFSILSTFSWSYYLGWMTRFISFVWALSGCQENEAKEYYEHILDLGWIRVHNPKIPKRAPRFYLKICFIRIWSVCMPILLPQSLMVQTLIANVNLVIIRQSCTQTKGWKARCSRIPSRRYTGCILVAASLWNSGTFYFGLSLTLFVYGKTYIHWP